MEVVAQVGQLVINGNRASSLQHTAEKKKQKGEKEERSATAGLFPHLTSISIVGLRNVDPHTLHAFLATLGAISTPTLPQTVTHLRLSSIDFALNHTLLATILPPPPPEKLASHSSSSSHHPDSLPSYSDSQLAQSTTLASLNLSSNPDTLTDATLASILAPSLAAMVSLTSLSLANCIQLSSSGLESLTPYTPWIKHLDISACPLMAANLGVLARALDAVKTSIESLNLTLATTGSGGGGSGGGTSSTSSGGGSGSPVTDSPQWCEPHLDSALVQLAKLKHLAIAYTDDDALPCVCSGLQIPLPTVLSLIHQGLGSLQITWQPGPNHHGGIPCGLVRRLVTHAVCTDSRRLEVTVVGKNALRSDRMVYYDRGSVVSGMLTVAAALRGCAENKCLGQERGVAGAAARDKSDAIHKAEGDYLVDAGFVAELNRELRVETGGGAVRVGLVTFEMMKD
ncbi:hypothetical protein BCR44DRAFT_1448098 [Catenaria anguillulae PL171]|uniref:RNI-like protein n=1 Tax=Catenaria anguillulae PL171 TaxID=765915 RepID=A0A1Y2H6W4_9FUNG|nr:hypothetical protein BCR44DRAFT_1448098 [Catenaria anguillulae PL171]